MNKCDDCKYRQYLARHFLEKPKQHIKYTYWMVFAADGGKYVDLEVDMPTKLTRATINAVKKHIKLQYGLENAILLYAILLEE